MQERQAETSVLRFSFTAGVPVPAAGGAHFRAIQCLPRRRVGEVCESMRKCLDPAGIPRGAETCGFRLSAVRAPVRPELRAAGRALNQRARSSNGLASPQQGEGSQSLEGPRLCSNQLLVAFSGSAADPAPRVGPHPKRFARGAFPVGDRHSRSLIQNWCRCRIPIRARITLPLAHTDGGAHPPLAAR